MGVIVSNKARDDLSVVEYAKNSSKSKCYKDKVKVALSSAIYFRQYERHYENIKLVPSMLIARLEGELFIYYKTDKKWFIFDKIADIDVPQNPDIKNGKPKSVL